jgi:hypothetical protein
MPDASGSTFGRWATSRGNFSWPGRRSGLASRPNADADAAAPPEQHEQFVLPLGGSVFGGEQRGDGELRFGGGRQLGRQGGDRG